MKAALLLGVLVLAGCPRSPEPVMAPAPQIVVTQPPPVGPPPPALNAVLASVGWALALPRERQAEEVDRWTVAVARDDLPTDRLRLALLLALGDPTIQDAEKVRSLLRGQWFHGEDLAAESLARVVLELVETRETSATTRLALAMELRKEREAREDLEAKLEAIQNIEAEMEARDRALVEGEGNVQDPGGR